MTLFNQNPIRSAATGIYVSSQKKQKQKVTYGIFPAAIVVSIAHFGTKVLSSLRMFPEKLTETLRLTFGTFYHTRSIPVDSDVNRASVHLGTFIYVSFYAYTVVGRFLSAAI